MSTTYGLQRYFLSTLLNKQKIKQYYIYVYMYICCKDTVIGKSEFVAKTQFNQFTKTQASYRPKFLFDIFWLS